jgi:dihydroxyacetone kinase-like protein
MDALIPADSALRNALESNSDLDVALREMSLAAKKGRDSTEDMVAKIGRSARLGERSGGVLDAGATSCALLLDAMKDAIIELL